MPYSAQGAVADAVFALLQDATLLQTLTGGWHGDVPQKPTYPFGWYELPTADDARGFGTGGMWQVQLRTHIFSLAGGLTEAREANRLTNAVLRDAALPAMTGYTQAGLVTFRETVELLDEELNGVKVHEIVTIFDLWAEEQ